jgi:FKBP-type peptidyl-prolyl cis-trans isomerase
MKHLNSGILVLILFAAFFSCEDDSMEKQRENELKKLTEYIQIHHSGLERKPSGLYYIELEKGNGDTIRIGDRVQLFYDLWKLDSTLVGTSGNYEPLELMVYPPGSLSYSAESPGEIKALHEALTYMQQGSKSLLIFDSGLGFGQYGTYGISGFTPLRMEVEVHKVYPAQTQE